MQDRYRFLFLLSGAVFLAMCSYTIVAPFLPGELIRRDLSQFYSGLILSLYNVLGLILGPITPRCFPRCGYTRIISIGALLLGSSLILFGVASYVPNNEAFVALNMIFRLMQGAGMSLTFQSAITVLPMVFHEDLGRSVAIRSIATSSGLAIGPLVGGVLYSGLGYVGPFAVIGGLALLYAIIFLQKLAKPLEKKMLSKFKQTGQQRRSKISCTTFVKRPDTFIAVIGWLSAIMGFISFEPILAPHLELKYGFNSTQVAYFYSIYTIASLLSNLCLAFKPLVSHLAHWNAIATFGNVICLFLIGPSHLLNLPQNLALVAIGIAGIGIFSPIVSLSSTLLVLEPLKKAYPSETGRIAALYGTIREITCAILFFGTPLLASGMATTWSYQLACDVFALISFGYLGAFIGIHIFHRPKKHSSLEEPLLEREQSRQ